MLISTNGPVTNVLGACVWHVIIWYTAMAALYIDWGVNHMFTFEPWELITAEYLYFFGDTSRCLCMYKIYLFWYLKWIKTDDTQLSQDLLWESFFYLWVPYGRKNKDYVWGARRWKVTIIKRTYDENVEDALGPERAGYHTLTFPIS